MMKNRYKVLIITCWALLLICFGIKLFGGNWFEIMVSNQRFIEICEYIDNNIILKIIIVSFFQIFSGYFILCISLNKNKLDKYDYIFCFPLMILRSVLGWYIEWITIIFDLLILLIYPLIRKNKITRTIIVCFYVMLLQLVSLFIRNILPISFNNNDFLISLIMQIDYYIMLILSYLYIFKNKLRKE